MGGYWDITNQLDEFSWDGELPDSICFTGQSSTGWPSGLGEQSYIEFYIMIGAWFDNGTFCIDTAGFGWPYDWLFEEPSPQFSGPYCWQVSLAPDMPLQLFSDCPEWRFLSHNTLFYYQFYAFHIYGDPISYELNKGPGSIHEITGEYFFTPDISEAGDTLVFKVRVYGDCNHGNFDECQGNLVIRSVCGDVNGDKKINILDITALIGYLYNEGAAPNYIFHADVNRSRSINILDATSLISYLYQNGPELSCRNIKEDFHLIPGSWWKYEIYDSLANVRDTVLLSVSDYHELTFNYGDSIIINPFDIFHDTILIYGIEEPRMFVMPFVSGDSWVNSYNYANPTSTVTEIITQAVPAGTYDETYHIAYNWGYGEEGIVYIDEYFVYGIGLIKQKYQDYDLFDGWRKNITWELIDYYLP